MWLNLRDDGRGARTRSGSLLRISNRFAQPAVYVFRESSLSFSPLNAIVCYAFYASSTRLGYFSPW
jgi:hypothetical protein